MRLVFYKIICCSLLLVCAGIIACSVENSASNDSGEGVSSSSQEDDDGFSVVEKHEDEKDEMFIRLPELSDEGFANAFDIFSLGGTAGNSSFSEQSSSSKQSSSSVWDWNSQDMDAESVYDSVAGTLTDLRDGQIYKVQYMYDEEKNFRKTWMDQNLNYAYMGKTAELDSSSFCYNDDPISCKFYGRLYIWSAAVDSASYFSEDCKDCGNGVKYGNQYGKQRGACPKGWHIPTITEFSSMYYNGGKFSTDYSIYGGNRGDDYYGADLYGYYWTTGELNETTAAYYRYYALISNVNYASTYKHWALSVRCVKDDDFDAPLERSSDYNLKPSIKYGSFVDERDGFVYRTVEIQNPSSGVTETWMAENLSFDYEKLLTGKSNPASCASYELTNCERYGRRYSWYQATDSAGLLNVDKAQGICPDGWRLPLDVDISDLIEAAGGNKNGLSNLKSTKGWNQVGVDSLGFSAVPFYYGAGSGGQIWSATEYDEERAYALSLSQDAVTRTINYFSTQAFVRCIKKSED